MSQRRSQPAQIGMKEIAMVPLESPKEGNPMTIATERKNAPIKSGDEHVDVEEVARIRLQLSPYRAIRRCSCSYDGEVLRLHGRVPTYHYKQLAQVAVTGLEGVRSIVNEIQVDTAP
jgi:hypothetical protein